jgi:undecaprenyl-diphosphatase
MTDHRSEPGGSAGRGAAAEQVGESRTSPLAWVAVGGVSYALFIALSVMVAQHAVFPFDQAWLDTARSWTQFNGLWQLLSNSANYPLIAIGVGIVLWLLWHRQYREAILVIIVLAACTAGSEAVKQLVARPRPLGTDPTIPGVVYSFPSGHTLEAATIYGIIAILIWRGGWPTWAKVGIALAFAVLVLLVGVARVAIVEHYPTDVIAGLLAGIGDLSVFAVLSPHRAAAPREAAMGRSRVKEPAG